jgi:hypothetical protein
MVDSVPLSRFFQVSSASCMALGRCRAVKQQNERSLTLQRSEEGQHERKLL